LRKQIFIEYLYIPCNNFYLIFVLFCNFYPMIPSTTWQRTHISVWCTLILLKSSKHTSYTIFLNHFFFLCKKKFAAGKYQSHIICSVTIKVPTFNEHELEHTAVEQQSPQEQPRDYMSILTDTYTRKREVGQSVTEQNLVWTYCILESGETY
jgi:hypothetical protein